ncbi:MAG: hypothetical protein GXY53_02855, partial [Desulfobulbus sp.]|nr:hypothetical protein [Desulfobulbus sp.]
MRNSNQQRNRTILSMQTAAVLLGLWISGCGRPVRDVPPPVPLPDGFSSAGDLPLPEKWWQSLGDPNLE